MKVYKIPEATVSRLSVYSRYLRQLMGERVETVSSNEIAKGVGVSSAQVRKDLAYFGEFGTRGVGYKVEDLYGHITKILGLDTHWNMVIIGAGKLGSALALYQGFYDRGFRVKAILDIDQDKIGIEYLGVSVEPIEKLAEKIKEHDIRIGVLTVPATIAQEVTDDLLEAGVGAILNFTPQLLRVPNHIILRNVDLSVNLEILSFHLANDK